MKKSTLKIAAICLAATLPLIGFASPASADSCVSQAEFAKIKNGMTAAAIKTLTGTAGTVFTSAGSGKYKVEVRSYKTCTKYGSVSIGFLGGKVNSKTGIS